MVLLQNRAYNTSLVTLGKQLINVYVLHRRLPNVYICIPMFTCSCQQRSRSYPNVYLSSNCLCFYVGVYVFILLTVYILSQCLPLIPLFTPDEGSCPTTNSTTTCLEPGFELVTLRYITFWSRALLPSDTV